MLRRLPSIRVRLATATLAVSLAFVGGAVAPTAHAGRVESQRAAADIVSTSEKTGIKAVVHSRGAARVTLVVERRNRGRWMELAATRRTVRSGRTVVRMFVPREAWTRVGCRARIRVKLSPSRTGAARQRSGYVSTRSLERRGCGSPRIALTKKTGGTKTKPARGDATQPSPTPTPAPGPELPRRDLGITEDVQYLSGPELDARLDAYVQLGVRWVRFQVIWDVVERHGPGTADWSRYDELVRELHERGLKPLAIIQTTPAWARVPDCEHVLCPPADAADYARFAAEAAARYAGRIQHWEIWNEPNNHYFWKPGPEPQAYAELLVAAHAAIKAADPQAVVVTGGLAPAMTERVEAGGYQWVNPVEFVSALYAHGASKSFDVLAAHPYTFPHLPPHPFIGSAWYEMYGTSPSIRSLMEAHGDAHKPIWATEFGAPTGPTSNPRALTEQEQAEMLERGYEEWVKHSWSGPMIIWAYHDWDADYEDAHFGLVRADGTKKAAYYSFQRLAGR